MPSLDSTNQEGILVPDELEVGDKPALYSTGSMTSLMESEKRSTTPPRAMIPKLSARPKAATENPIPKSRSPRGQKAQAPIHGART
ncbi:MAG: hypothetical protein ACKPKO_11340, partial [Candidatus Fonsibacter sp.]